MVYTPARFAYPEAAAVALVQRLRFGTVISSENGELHFSYLPLLPDVVDGKITQIRGHFARANPQWRALEKHPKATIVFNGPNAYISAQWYMPDNAAGPTWDYMVVHVDGIVELMPDVESASGIIDELIEINEAALPRQWDARKYDPKRRAALLPHVVAFKLAVTSFQPIFKLTQHYSDADKRSIATGLLAQGTDAGKEIAEHMIATCDPERASPGADVAASLKIPD